jgi:hypothetical protein
MQGTEKQENLRPNENLLTLLKEINEFIGPVEERILQNYKYSHPRYPVTFIVGASRCGTTLLMQWLANSGNFAYPTNLLSRFYEAPYIGAKIQLLLTSEKYNYNNELLDFSPQVPYKSSLGKTQGALSPNGFWFFWRRFLPIHSPQHMDEAELEKIDHEGLTAELAAFEDVFKKPIVMKGLFFVFNIPYLASLLKNSLFIYLKRQPFYNIQSLLEARIKNFGSRDQWYSVKPQQYETLKDLDPIGQVTGQVYFTNKAIQMGINQIPSANSLVVNYEDFCQDPEGVFSQIQEKFSMLGYSPNWTYSGPEKFKSTNQIKLTKEESRQIIDTYYALSHQRLELI